MTEKKPKKDEADKKSAKAKTATTSTDKARQSSTKNIEKTSVQAATSG